MLTEKRLGIVFVCLLSALQISRATPVAAADGPVDAKTIERLEGLIQDQQKQLEALKEQVNQLKQAAKPPIAEAKAVAPAPVERAVTSGQKKVTLAISGQVNRAVNVADDGDSTKVYYVDNDASNSRIRFVGTAKVNDDVTIGSRIEYAFAPNESSTVNQDSEGGDENYVQGRWAEVSVASKSYGKLSLGKGDTASNNTAEVDLSRVDVIAYASTSDIAAGLKFRTESDKTLTGTKVSDAFSDQDGLSRQSRARYDTPTFYGFSLAGSVVSDQRSDAALFWGGQGSGFKAAGAVAVSYPNQSDTSLRYDGSLSVLHEGTGLNLTLSAGRLDKDEEDDPTNLYGKLGWIANFFAFGSTAFAVDYTRSLNLPTGSDDGYSLGGAVVQLLDDYGTEIYAQYRRYSLTRDSEPSVDAINVGTVGARLKF